MAIRMRPSQYVTLQRQANFRSVETREDFTKVFGSGVRLPVRPETASQAGLRVQTRFDDDAASYFNKTELAPALAVIRSLVRVRDEKARGLVVYDVLKLISKLERNSLILEARTVAEAVDDERPYVSDTEESEESSEGSSLESSVEFLVFAGSDTTETGPVRFVCEVKDYLELYWNKTFWQFLAKLTIAAQTWGEQEVYGALTNAIEWYFFKVTLLAGDTWEIEAALPLRLVDPIFGATCGTTATITMLLQAMYPSKQRFQLADVTACNKSDPEWALDFLETAKVGQKINAEEDAKLKAEVGKKRSFRF
ncbi:MAG: hypothetical protein Q9180_007409 [Flavoplaca navasiana]